MLPTYFISGLPATCRSGVDDTANTHNSFSVGHAIKTSSHPHYYKELQAGWLLDLIDLLIIRGELTENRLADGVEMRQSRVMVGNISQEIR